jgi:cell division septation protein DedD
LSLRAAIFALLFANLAFFGWAHLVDVTPEPPPTESIEHLPQLKLLSEVQNSSGTAHSSTTPNSATRPQASSSTSVSASAPGSGSGPSGASGGTSVSPSVSSSASSASTEAALRAAPAARTAAASPATQRCVTIGPFTDTDRVAKADDLLQQRGFKVRERLEQLPQQGFWVFVGGLKSESDETALVRRLQQNGVSDASVMPDSNAGRRVSVGFFTERDGAERRARTVRGLGLHADIEKRTQDAPAHWVDVNIDSSGQSLPAEGLLGLEESGERLEIKECPAAKVGGAGGAPPGLS